MDVLFFWILLLITIVIWLWDKGRKTEFVAPRTPAEEERLAELIRRGDRLVEYVEKNKYPNKEVAQRIHENWNVLKRTKKIGVTPPSTDTPGFVINKSDAMQICLTTSPDKPHDLDELNLNTFVLIHEISHLGALEYEHGSEFMSVFKKMLRASLNLGIWKYVDYRKNPQMYCNYFVDATPTIPDSFAAVYDDL
jgi:hypothetical protein